VERERYLKTAIFGGPGLQARRLSSAVTISKVVKGSVHLFFGSMPELKSSLVIERYTSPHLPPSSKFQLCLETIRPFREIIYVRVRLPGAPELFESSPETNLQENTAKRIQVIL
jgi:hypothetical protein